MSFCYDEKGVKLLDENKYIYHADRCLFCVYFIEERLVNDYLRHGYCKELKLEISESGICKKFLGL